MLWGNPPSPSLVGRGGLGCAPRPSPCADTVTWLAADTSTRKSRGSMQGHTVFQRADLRQHRLRHARVIGAMRSLAAQVASRRLAGGHREHGEVEG